MTTIPLTINGTRQTVDVDPETPLLWVLRDTLMLTGTKFGCGVAACGACTVHLDGVPTRACQTPIGTVGTAAITTIEGAAAAVTTDTVAAAVQSAWRDADVVQCGYCQSGQIMAAIALLRETPKPSDADIDMALAGNLCRCATYVRIRAAVHLAATRLEA